jgi:hypothetical protein
VSQIQRLHEANPFAEQRPAHGKAQRIVQTQGVDGRASDATRPDQLRPVPIKMLCAPIASRVEQADNPVGIQIQPREIRAFEVITMKARKRQIIGCGLATM